MGVEEKKNTWVTQGSGKSHPGELPMAIFSVLNPGTHVPVKSMAGSRRKWAIRPYTEGPGLWEGRVTHVRPAAPSDSAQVPLSWACPRSAFG